MALRRISVPWTQQPQEAVAWDWDARARLGLCGGAIIAGDGRLVGIDDALIVPYDTAVYGEAVTEYGRTLRYSRSGTYGALSASTGSPSSRSFTYLARVRTFGISGTGVVARTGSALGGLTASNGTTLPLWRSDGKFGLRVNDKTYTAAGAYIDGEWFDLEVVGDAAACRLYINGAVVINGAAAASGSIQPWCLLDGGGSGFGGGAYADLAYALWSDRPLSAEVRAAFRANPWQIFAPRQIWVPVSAGGDSSTITAVTSLSAAVQLAQQLTAGLSAAVQSSPSAVATVGAVVQAARSAQSQLDVAVQTSGQSTTSASVAVQAARTAQAGLTAAVQQAHSAVATLAAAVQAPGVQSTALAAAVQLAGSAVTSLDLAVQAQGSATTGASLQVQAGHSVSTGVSLQVQAGSSVSVAASLAVLRQALATVGLSMAVVAPGSASAGLSVALRAAQSATSTLALAVQAARNVSASVSLQVQDGLSITAALDVAVQRAASATTAVQLAIAQAATANASLAAAVMVQRSVAAAISSAIKQGKSIACGLNLYVALPDAPPDSPIVTVTDVTVIDRYISIQLAGQSIVANPFIR